jgi:polysaccharide export outer membrane protein
MADDFGFDGPGAMSTHQAYRIAPGDTVSITVWGYEQFSQDCEVNGSGTISYPLLGDVPAVGLTCGELQANLQERLGEYLKEPHVLVKVLRYGTLGTSVFILGEVKTPGVYPLVSGTGVMQALAMAGGTTSLASGEISIVKAGTGDLRTVGIEEAMTPASATGAAAVGPGDVIVVQKTPGADRARRYAVLGEVPKPGVYDMPADGDVSVLDAMRSAGMLSSKSGGSGAPYPRPIDDLARTGDLAHALLTRGDVIVPLDLVSLLRGDIAQNVLLQDGDVLTVPRRALITVYALGEVRIPGRHMLPENSTVVDLLNASEGVTSAAKLWETTVLRAGEGDPTPISVDLRALLQRADSEHNVVLQNADVLFVPTRGERKPGIQSFLPLISYLLH